MKSCRKQNSNMAWHALPPHITKQRKGSHSQHACTPWRCPCAVHQCAPSCAVCNISHMVNTHNEQHGKLCKARARHVQGVDTKPAAPCSSPATQARLLRQALGHSNRSHPELQLDRGSQSCSHSSAVLYSAALLPVYNSIIQCTRTIAIEMWEKMQAGYLGLVCTTLGYSVP